MGLGEGFAILFLECLTLKKKYFVEEQLRRVVHISVCGQMHGVVYWKQGKGWTRNSKDQVENFFL